MEHTLRHAIQLKFPLSNYRYNVLRLFVCVCRGNRAYLWTHSKRDVDGRKGKCEDIVVTELLVRKKKKL